MRKNLTKGEEQLLHTYLEKRAGARRLASIVDKNRRSLIKKMKARGLISVRKLV